MGGSAVLPIKYLINAYGASEFRREYMPYGFGGENCFSDAKKYKNYLGRTKLALNVDRRHIVKANLVLLFYWKKEDVNGYDEERAD